MLCSIKTTHTESTNHSITIKEIVLTFNLTKPDKDRDLGSKPKNRVLKYAQNKDSVITKESSFCDG